jgi:hypothetical protein
MRYKLLKIGTIQALVIVPIVAVLSDMMILPPAYYKGITLISALTFLTIYMFVVLATKESTPTARKHED